MKKTLYPHIFLLTEGRLGFIAFALFAIYLLLMLVKALILGEFSRTIDAVISTIVIVAGVVVTYFYLLPLYWPLCFGELTLTEGYVKWHALFMRSVKIPYSELRYVEIRRFDEGNVVPDLYGTGQMYVLLSTKPLPKKRIDKIRCGDGLIKYQFLMRDAAVFSKYLPELYKPMFQSRAEAYTRAKEKQARDWQKWKAKRKKAREKRGKSGRLKNTKSIDRSGRCSSTARVLFLLVGLRSRQEK